MPAGKRPSNLLLWGSAFAINVLWALAYPLSKEAMETMPPLGLTTWRLIGASAILLPFLRKKDIPTKPMKRDLTALVAMGLIGCGLSTALQFVATSMTLASNVSLLVALETLFGLLLAHFFLGERAGFRGWAGALAAFVGVGLISVDPANLSLGGEYARGNLVMTIASLCYSTYTIFGKKISERWGATAMTAIPFAFTAAVMAPFFYLTDREGFFRALHPTPLQWAVIALVSIGAGAGFLIWNWILKYLSAGSISLSLYFQPVVGVLFSRWYLGERISGPATLGAGLILGGVALSELKWVRSKDSTIVK